MTSPISSSTGNVPVTQVPVTDTNGWDTVTAIRFPEMNQAIVKMKRSPLSFDESQSDDDDGTVSFKGKFGDWQLSGGDGKLVWLDLPISEATFGFGGKIFSYPLPMTATIEVNMEWVQEQASESSTTNSENGGIATSISNQLKVAPGIRVVVQQLFTGDNTEPSGKPVSEVHSSLMKSTLEAWLTQNVASFDHVFATVDIAEDAAKGPLAWLKPTDKMYAVTSAGPDAEQMDNKIFGVLTMTDKNKNPGDHEISPFAIPADCRAAFLISPERFMTQMLQPGLPLLFLGKSTIVEETWYPPESTVAVKREVETWGDAVQAEDFQFSGTALSNGVAMRFHDQTLENGKVVQPVIDAGKFQLTFKPEGLEMELSDLRFDYSWGICVHMEHKANAVLEIDENRCFKLTVKRSVTSAAVTTSEEVKIFTIIGSIAASIILSAVGGMIGGSAAAGAGEAVVNAAGEGVINTIEVIAEEGAEAAVNVATEAATEAGEEAAESASILSGAMKNIAAKAGDFKLFLAKAWPKILGTIIGGAVGGATGTIPTIIEAIANNNASIPSLDDLGTAALSPVQWANLEQDSFVVLSGGINGCIQIGFTITKTHQP